MSRFEDNLRKALREPEAPADLAGRILARAAKAQPQRRRVWHPLRIAAAITLVAVLAATGLHYERRRTERIANERALAQVVEAFRLAEERLRPFRQRLETMRTMTISIPEGEPQK